MGVREWLGLPLGAVAVLVLALAALGALVAGVLVLVLCSALVLVAEAGVALVRRWAGGAVGLPLEDAGGLVLALAGLLGLAGLLPIAWGMGLTWGALAALGGAWGVL